MKKYHELWNVDISTHQVYPQQSYIKQISEPQKVSVQTKASELQQSGQNLPDYDTFLHGTKQLETLDTQAQMEEFMFLGLRLTKGISTKAFEDYFHTPIREVYQTVIDKHLKDGTLILDGDRLYLSEHGMDVANYVMSDFII